MIADIISPCNFQEASVKINPMHTRTYETVINIIDPKFLQCIG